MSKGNKASEEAAKPTGRPAHFRERRRWKRKDISAQGKMRIICGLDQGQSTRWITILINDISTGGIRAQVPFISLDDLHVVGDLTNPVWMSNILDIELELPAGAAQKLSFQGNARWYLRIGVGPDYLLGVSINTISRENRDNLLNFLEREGV
ncbi:MAG: PilZ domain-containing protein [Thermodesulfobacteriota bacterium]